MPRGLIVSRTRSRWSRTEISSVTQDTSRRDSFGGGRLLERDRSLDPDPVLEGPVPLDRQRRRIPQGGSTLGEPLVELADQSVDLRVERDVGKTLRDLLQPEVGPAVIYVRAQPDQVVGGLTRDQPLAPTPPL